MESSRTCPNLDSEIASLIKEGYRLDMIMPADAPREALVSKGDEKIRLSANPKSTIQNPKSAGRAGMVYRDLIPDRLGGRVIASHITITDGGEVPDYVHYHKIKFQMIYCRRGWVRVVYEDQGPPFVLDAGDCVLQPPEIRHRVLESSAGAEVVEIGSPAEHETWVEHDIELPTKEIAADRLFRGQRFVRYVSSDAEWDDANESDTGISAATEGIADVRVKRLTTKTRFERLPSDREVFIYVLKGRVRIGSDLKPDDCILFHATQAISVEPLEESELLVVTLPR